MTEVGVVDSTARFCLHGDRTKVDRKLELSDKLYLLSIEQRRRMLLTNPQPCLTPPMAKQRKRKGGTRRSWFECKLGRKVRRTGFVDNQPAARRSFFVPKTRGLASTRTKTTKVEVNNKNKKSAASWASRAIALGKKIKVFSVLLDPLQVPSYWLDPSSGSHRLSERTEKEREKHLNLFESIFFYTAI